MFSQYDSQDTTNTFVHVMGWGMIKAEFLSFVPALMKIISSDLAKVSFFYMPSTHGSVNFNLQCCPSIHKELTAKVSNISF